MSPFASSSQLVRSGTFATGRGTFRKDATHPPTAQANRTEAFRDPHAGPDPLRLVNAWDGLSARVFAQAGAPAIGTSSFAVALANGYQDGQRIPWSRVCQVVAAAGEVSVTADIEAGQGADPEDVARSVSDVLTAVPALAEALGTFADECAPYPIEELVLVHETEHELACN